MNAVKEKYTEHSSFFSCELENVYSKDKEDEIKQ